MLTVYADERNTSPVCRVSRRARLSLQAGRLLDHGAVGEKFARVSTRVLYAVWHALMAQLRLERHWLPGPASPERCRKDRVFEGSAVRT